MSATGIIAIFILATVLTAIFAFGFRTRGPWGTMWTFFLMLILAMWSMLMWVPPIGPLWYGVAWIDLFIVGFLLALLLAAATPSANRYRESSSKEDFAGREQIKDGTEAAAVVVGGFFWTLLLLFTVLIIVGFV